MFVGPVVFVELQSQHAAHDGLDRMNEYCPELSAYLRSCVLFKSELDSFILKNVQSSTSKVQFRHKYLQLMIEKAKKHFDVYVGRMHCDHLKRSSKLLYLLSTLNPLISRLTQSNLI